MPVEARGVRSPGAELHMIITRLNWVLGAVSGSLEDATVFSTAEPSLQPPALLSYRDISGGWAVVAHAFNPSTWESEAGGSL